MICVFNNIPLALGVTASPFSPFVQKASTAAAETVNEIYWITLNYN